VSQSLGTVEWERIAFMLNKSIDQCLQVWNKISHSGTMPSQEGINAKKSGDDTLKRKRRKRVKSIFLC